MSAEWRVGPTSGSGRRTAPQGRRPPSPASDGGGSAGRKASKWLPDVVKIVSRNEEFEQSVRNMTWNELKSIGMSGIHTLTYFQIYHSYSEVCLRNTSGIF